MKDNEYNKRSENTEEWSDNEWQEYFSEVEQKDKESQHFREIGKLGGRPKKDTTQNERITVRLTSLEKRKAEEKAEKLGVTLSEYCRRAIENKPFPDKERNLVLLEYRTNFSRLSNYFKRNIWSESEKSEFLKELRVLIDQLKKELG